MAHMIKSKVWVRFIIQIFILIELLHIAQASGNDISELRERIFSYEDTKITVQDLAFYLVTHNYDAVPRDGYVELQFGGENYRLVPNRNAPGLCDIFSLNAKK
jgi:hypothetical protein